VVDHKLGTALLLEGVVGRDTTVGFSLAECGGNRWIADSLAALDTCKIKVRKSINKTQVVAYLAQQCRQQTADCHRA
jgi:hypothetical protein